MKLPSQLHLHWGQRYTTASKKQPAWLTSVGLCMNTQPFPRSHSYKLPQHPQLLLLVAGMLGLPHYWWALPSFSNQTLTFDTKALNSLYVRWDLTLSPASASPTLNYLPSSETLRCLLLWSVNKMDFKRRYLCISGQGCMDNHLDSPFQGFKIHDLPMLSLQS